MLMIELEDLEDFEQRILLRSVCETIVPKLLLMIFLLLSNLLQGVFPGSSIPIIKEPELRENLKKLCKQMLL
jgi:dynein heavy chain 1